MTEAEESARLSRRNRATRRNHQPSGTERIARKKDGRDPRSQTRRAKNGQGLAPRNRKRTKLSYADLIHRKRLTMQVHESRFTAIIFGSPELA
jgi:hypothetical protein